MRSTVRSKTTKGYKQDAPALESDAQSDDKAHRVAAEVLKIFSA